MENIQDALQNDMHICMMSISGSFVSAIKDTARFAEAMLSKPAVDTPDIFAPISHDNGDHIYL